MARLGGADASGWLGAFRQDAAGAVADLVWNRFYFGPLNVTERGQLLANWLEVLGAEEGFAAELDAQLAGWVETHWGRFEQPGVMLASAWTCVASVVEFSARLNPPERLFATARALRARFTERERFLGSFSTAPAADPLGLYLAVIAEFQGDDRSLAGFWHRLCDLPDGAPFYHARFAILGLRRLKAATHWENGTLRSEIVLGLLRLASAFDRLVRERGLAESAAKSEFRRVATQLAAAYPNSPFWREHGLAQLLDMPDRPRKWVTDAVRPLAEALRKEQASPLGARPAPRRSVQPGFDWVPRAKELANSLQSDGTARLPEVDVLLNEERRYAEATGDTSSVVRSLCYFASRILKVGPTIARQWAEEAQSWDPRNPFAWTTITNVLLRQKDVKRALHFAWVAWKRFPENVVARTGLAEVLKADGRYPEAEVIYRQTIECFPENVVARSGLAEVLKAGGRYPEAEVVYRQTIERFPESAFARNGLADTLRRANRRDDAERVYRDAIDAGHCDACAFVGLAHLLLRQGEAGRAEALDLVDEALRLEPRDPFALALKQRIQGARGAAVAAIAEDWDDWANALSDFPSTNQSDPSPPPGDSATLSFETEESADCGPQVLAPVSALPAAAPAQPPPIGGSLPPKVDPVEFAAILAEASFYRSWAARSSPGDAIARRQKAEALLERAEILSPQDAQIAAERAGLLCSHTGVETAGSPLLTELRKYPACAPLLVLKARLDRESAQKARRELSDEALAQLLQAPARLRNLDPALAPLFQLEQGLATLALLDGVVRLQKAADSFTAFRSTVSRRAREERTGREASHDARAKETPRFHEWLLATTSHRLFRGFPEPETVRVEDVPVLEQALAATPFLADEIEDVMIERLAFSGV